MKLNALLSIIGNLAGIGPFAWAAIRRVATHRTRKCSSKSPASAHSAITIAIHSDGPLPAASITASVTFSAHSRKPRPGART
jgi:hypothetical protein